MLRNGSSLRETRGRSPRYLNLFLNIAGLGFEDRRKVTLWAKEDPFAVNFSSLLGSKTQIWGHDDKNRDCKSVLSFGMRVRRSIFLAQQCICLGISDHELLLWIPRQASA
jgi:hypothetical protein